MIREGIDGLVCDLDGVVYRGDAAVPGSADAVAALRDAGVGVVFCTNNSSGTVDLYVERLARIGIAVSPDEILTSAVVTAEVLQQRGYAGKRAFVIGGAGIRSALADMGIAIADDGVDVVVVGLDTGFDYAALRTAADAARAGAPLIATNDDATLPLEAGRQWPGAGALVAAVERASGRRAEVMGKPHAPMLDAAAARLAGARRIAMVGDRPETDLAGAHAREWTTVLVLSGVTSADEVDRIDPRPDIVVERLADFVARDVRQ